MRTNIIIDDQLMREALQVTGMKTKKAVEEGLRFFITMKIRELRDKLRWERDLEKMRTEV